MPMPQMASIFVGVLTGYLAATGAMTMKRGAGDSGMFEIGAFLTAAGAGGALILLGLAAATNLDGRLQGATAGPYWAFAVFALFAAALDLNLILRGALGERRRLVRQAWRIGLALVFAGALVFLSELYVLALAFLAGMAVWLTRARLDRRRVVPRRYPRPAPSAQACGTAS